MKRKFKYGIKELITSCVRIAGGTKKGASVSKLRKIRIRFPVFSNYLIHAEVTPDITETLQKYKHLRDIDPERLIDGDGCTIQRNEFGLSYVFLRPDVTVGTIAHESYHATVNLLNFIRADMEDELVAYHVGFVADKIYELIKKR